MASTFRLDSQSYDGRYMYLSCAQRQDIAGNKSYIDWTLTVEGGTDLYYQTGPTTVTINGTQVYYMKKLLWTDRIFPAGPGSTRGTLEVPHTSDGTKTITCSITTAIYTGVLKTKSDTWTLDKITRQAYIETANGFTDEENPSFSFTKAGTGTIDVWLEPNPVGEHICIRTGIPNTGSYTWELTDNERALLRTKCANANICWCRIGIYTHIDGATYQDWRDVTYSIVNANPELTVTVTDENTAVSNVVGNGYIVRYLSIPIVTANYTLKKGATLKSLVVKNGNAYQYATPAFFNYPSSGTFEVSLVDSRGNTPATNPAVVTKTLIPYVMLTCEIDDARMNTDGVLSISASGNYYSGSIGSRNNSLTLQCRYRRKDASSWTSGGTIVATVSDNTYSGSKTIHGLDETAVYEVEVYATDAFGTKYSNNVRVKSLPIFDYGENDFNFNVPVSITGMNADGLMQKIGIKIDPESFSEYPALRFECDLPVNLGNVDTPYQDHQVANKWYVDNHWGDNISSQYPSGAWTVREWKSGLAECWGTLSVQSGAWGGSGSIYAVTKTIPLPSGLFVAAPDVMVAVKNAGGAIVTPSIIASTANSFNTTFVRFYEGADDKLLTLFVHAIGRWE